MSGLEKNIVSPDGLLWPSRRSNVVQKKIICDMLVVATVSGILLAALGCSDVSPEVHFARLASADADERREAAYALLSYDKEIILPRLLQQVQSEDGRVRLVAVQLLGKLGDERSTPVLSRALDDPIDRIAAKAASALAKVPGAAAEKSLLRALDHRAEVVVLEALEGLTVRRPVGALSEILTRALNSAVGVRCASLRALGACYSHARSVALRDSARVTIVSALRAAEPSVRIAAMVAARELGYRDMVPTIIDLAKDVAPEVRHVAIQALGEVASGSANGAPLTLDPSLHQRLVDTLILALDEPEYQSIRSKAIRALGASGVAGAREHLEELRDHGSPVDIREAEWALKSLKRRP